MQRIVTLKMGEGMLRVLDEYAKRRRLSRSEVIREAIKEYLARKGVKIDTVMGEPNYTSRPRSENEEFVIIVEI